MLACKGETSIAKVNADDMGCDCPPSLSRPRVTSENAGSHRSRSPLLSPPPTRAPISHISSLLHPAAALSTHPLPPPPRAVVCRAVMAVNVVGPAVLTSALWPRLRRKKVHLATAFHRPSNDLPLLFIDLPLPLHCCALT